RLYTFKSDSPERRAAQWVLRNILVSMTRLMAPILSFTAEEVWGHVKQTVQGAEDSVFLSEFPVVDEKYLDPEIEKKWGDLFALRNEVNKALEIKRAEKFIGNSLEAKIMIRLPERYSTILSGDKDFLSTFFIVSAVEIVGQGAEDAYKSSEIEGLEIKIEKAPGDKCQRCWNRRESVGAFADAPDVCDRCHEVISAK
ncbi:MAG TPA: class I tRNA ligase family protein, partial [Thermodesulfovibrionales bacterium]|nr:class I tRNA ligase family protein [Thermodesulfovibrionales bacterium]